MVTVRTLSSVVCHSLDIKWNKINLIFVCSSQFSKHHSITLFPLPRHFTGWLLFVGVVALVIISWYGTLNGKLNGQHNIEIERNQYWVSFWIIYFVIFLRFAYFFQSFAVSHLCENHFIRIIHFIHIKLALSARLAAPLTNCT